MKRHVPTRGQATVEFAIVLPIVVSLVLLCVQVGVLARDRLVLVNATRAVARSVIVSPDIDSAREVLRRQGAPASSASISLDGDVRSGGSVRVSLTMRPTQVPIVGRVVSRIRLSESLSVYVEGEG